MARSKLSLEPQVVMDNRTKLVKINGLEMKDPEFFKIISDLKEKERPEFVEKALKVGAIVLRDVVIGKKMDYIRGEFQRFRFELEKTLGEDGMKGELERIFGRNGELELCLEKLFGDDGRLVRDILDMDNKKSPVGRLRETIESYFVGKDSEVYSMLDPNKEGSPMSRMKKEIMDELTQLRSTIEERIIRKEIIEKTPKKGLDFEDDLEVFLQSISKPYNDVVERVGTKPAGKLGKKGDFLIAISDPTIKGAPPKIVIEAKTGEVSPNALLRELAQEIESREAKFAIGVTDSVISEAIGSYREFQQDKIICTFVDGGLPLEVAYKIARTKILMGMYPEIEKEIDVERINGTISKISNDLNAIRGIRTKLTSIGKTSESIKNDVKSLETNIRDSLVELQDSLRFGDRAID